MRSRSCTSAVALVLTLFSPAHVVAQARPDTTARVVRALDTSGPRAAGRLDDSAALTRLRADSGSTARARTEAQARTAPPCDSVPRRGAAPGNWQTANAVLVLLLYALGLLLARWYHIAKSVHAMIENQIFALETRLRTETGSASTIAISALTEAVARLRKSEDEYISSWHKPSEFFFWSRGRENATWAAIHEIERQLAAHLSPPEQVDAYLRWADAELRTLDDAAAIAIADGIRVALQKEIADGTPERLKQDDINRALLGRGLAIIYSRRDTSFSTLMEWQNKAGWLILAALIIIGFLVGVAGHSVLFLAGAAGGYLSRLMRTLKREDVPLDYGASWTTLFLSPLFGAMAGWFGIALIVLLTRSSVHLLGDAFDVVCWNDPTAPATIGIAFILGFSERLFDAIVGAVEQNAERGEMGKRAAQGAGAAGGPGGPGPSTTVPTPSTSTAPMGTTGFAAAAMATSAPVIVTTERRASRNNIPGDVLRVEGRGFAVGCKATVNGGDARELMRESDTVVWLALTADDSARLDASGDFHVVIVNPDGAASAPHDA